MLAAARMVGCRRTGAHWHPDEVFLAIILRTPRVACVSPHCECCVETTAGRQRHSLPFCWSPLPVVAGSDPGARIENGFRTTFSSDEMGDRRSNRIFCDRPALWASQLLLTPCTLFPLIQVQAQILAATLGPTARPHCLAGRWDLVPSRGHGF